MFDHMISTSPSSCLLTVPVRLMRAVLAEQGYVGKPIEPGPRSDRQKHGYDDRSLQRREKQPM